jgi:DNA-binding IclR family transcriptional regulator
MPRNSPAVERVVSVLNFFAEHPQQSFNLSQVVRSLRLSRATCHAMLSALVDSGYLFRNTDKTFVLGPTILAIGRNAEQSFSAVDVARRELRKLADEFDVVAVAVFADKGQIVIRERAASRTHLGWAPPPGVSYPIYPWGVVFAAHLPPAQLESWLDQATPRLTAEQRAEAHEKVAFLRTHGFVFAVHDASRMEPMGDTPGSSRNPGRTITKLDPKASYELHYIEAPVMNERGAAGFALALHNFSGSYTGEQVAAIAERLRESCRRVTTFVAGRHGPASFG